MKEWYLMKMVEMHEAGNMKERDNYAKAAGVDFVKWFYLKM